MWIIIFSCLIILFSAILTYINYRILVVEIRLREISEKVLQETILLRKSLQITDDDR